jgi:hypothetical protein
MMHRSSTVQQALFLALLRMLQSPDLSPEDTVWVQQFAIRMIMEFNLAHDNKEAPERPIAA